MRGKSYDNLSALTWIMAEDVGIARHEVPRSAGILQALRRHKAGVAKAGVEQATRTLGAGHIRQAHMQKTGD